MKKDLYHIQEELEKIWVTLQFKVADDSILALAHNDGWTLKPTDEMGRDMIKDVKKICKSSPLKLKDTMTIHGAGMVMIFDRV